jgi:hypothetical protein
MDWEMRAHRRLFVVWCTLLIWAGCAAGEPFGDGSGPGVGTSAIECDENADCWDGDPATEDVCTQDGRCAFLTNVKSDPEKDSEESIPSCQFASVIDGYAELHAELEQPVAEAVHTIPVEYGELFRVSVDAPTRLEVVLDKELEGVLFVLLDECTNACKNRIVWGNEICSPVLEVGEYVLVVFSERELEFYFTAELLPPEESCGGLDVTVDC